jgi:hypothetical protein
MNVGPEATYTAPGDIIDIRLNATDPDDSTLEFEVFNKPVRSRLEKTSSTTARFNWDPLADDTTPADDPLELIFIARDPHGAQARAEHIVHIRSSNGRPSFVTQSSHVFDPSAVSNIEIPIEVDDKDSQDVTIRMKSDTAPSNSSFEQTGSKRGTFTWTPTSEQLNQNVHSVTFVADDGDFEPVELELSILFNQSS